MYLQILKSIQTLSEHIYLKRYNDLSILRGRGELLGSVRQGHPLSQNLFNLVGEG